MNIFLSYIFNDINLYIYIKYVRRKFIFLYNL